MKFFLAYILALSMLMIIFFYTTIRIHLQIRRNHKDDWVKIEIITWWGLIRFQNEYSVITLAKDFSGVLFQTELESSAEPLDQLKFKFTTNEMMQLHYRMYHWYQKVRMLNQIIKQFLKTIRIDRFVWRSKIGSGDAAVTGVLTGIIWGIKAGIMGICSSYVTLRTIPNIMVQPFFNEKRLETEFEGIFRLRIGKAMVAGIRILLNLRKRRDSKWQNTLYKA